MPKKTGGNQKHSQGHYDRSSGRGRGKGTGMSKTVSDLLKQLGEAAEKQKKQTEMNSIAHAVALARESLWN